LGVWEGYANGLFQMNLHCALENHDLPSDYKHCQFVDSEHAPMLWYDDYVRIADYFASPLASFHWGSYTPKIEPPKYDQILKAVLLDNPNIVTQELKFNPSSLKLFKLSALPASTVEGHMNSPFDELPPIIRTMLQHALTLSIASFALTCLTNTWQVALDWRAPISNVIFWTGLWLGGVAGVIDTVCELLRASDPGQSSEDRMSEVKYLLGGNSIKFLIVCLIAGIVPFLALGGMAIAACFSLSLIGHIVPALRVSIGWVEFARLPYSGYLFAFLCLLVGFVGGKVLPVFAGRGTPIGR
jgi:hypothetical protein